MTPIIAYLIAGLSTAALLTLWFVIAYQRLALKKQGVVAAAEQVQMHRNLFRQARGGPDAKAAQRMFDTSRLLYEEAAKCYNKTLKKPIYRFPGLIMGFRLLAETKAKL